MTTRTNSAVRPFEVHVPDDELAGLRRRIAATRWPPRETVTDESQGVPLAMIQELAGYWATEYNWRRCEATLNALPHFITEIDVGDWRELDRRARDGAVLWGGAHLGLPEGCQE